MPSRWCASSPAGSTPTLLRLAAGHQLDARRFVITHHFTLDAFEEAQDVFSWTTGTAALEVVLTKE